MSVRFRPSAPLRHFLSALNGLQQRLSFRLSLSFFSIIYATTPLGMFNLLKNHGFNLIARDHSTNKKNNASNNPDFLFNSKEDEHYFECTTRASSLIDFFFKLLPKFKFYLLVAQLFAKKHDDLKTINILRLENTFWNTSIEVLSHEFSETEKQSVVNTLGFDNFKEAKNDFINWIYYVHYAYMYHKGIINPSFISDLNKIDFPIGIEENQDIIAQSLKHAAKCVAQAMIDKMAKDYFQNDKPVTLAISFSLKSDVLTVPCPLKLMSYLKTHLSEILKTQAEIKKIKYDIAGSLTNLYAIILDTCWYNLLPTIAMRYGAKFIDGFTNNYASLYNANHPLVSKGLLIYSKIPYQDFISLEL